MSGPGDEITVESQGEDSDYEAPKVWPKLEELIASQHPYDEQTYRYGWGQISQDFTSAEDIASMIARLPFTAEREQFMQMCIEHTLGVENRLLHLEGWVLYLRTLGPVSYDNSVIKNFFKRPEYNVYGLEAEVELLQKFREFTARYAPGELPKVDRGIHRVTHMIKARERRENRDNCCIGCFMFSCFPCLLCCKVQIMPPL